MSVDAQHHDTAVLLMTEHAVARVLGEARDEAGAYPRLLAEIGASLGWAVGALWTEVAGGGLRCVATWRGPEPFVRATRAMSLDPGEGLPGRVWASGEPAWIADVLADPNFPRRDIAADAGLHAAFCFPLAGTAGVLGAMEFLTDSRREADEHLLRTMTSIGARIGQRVEQWRAEARLRESEARKSAILDAALDSVITMDVDGRIVELNPAAERTFGYPASEMVGRDLADLIIPPSLREAHRDGLRRYVTTGQSSLLGHPVELPAMRADGSEFPVEIAITRPLLGGPAQFTGYLRDITERKRDEEALRSLAEEQAALRRVATVVASGAVPERVFAVVTEEVGHLLGAHTSNMARYEPDGTGIVVGAWSTAGVRAVPVGTRVALDGPTVSARVLRSGRPERVDSYEGIGGTTAEMLRGLGFRSAVGAPIKLAGRLWGSMMVSTVEEQPFREHAEQRIADFAELVSLALANAESRKALAASRARIVEVGDAERRRLERNLHDGAQQRLVALAVTLRLSEAKLARGDLEAVALLRQANAELGEALEELRELARGIHPAILTDRGLVPALEMLAGRAIIPVEMATALDERLPDAVEAAAYYIVAEALTNASRHAGASHLRVRVSRVDARAVVEVADDGCGGADLQRGSGLRGLGDRVEALGGTFELESPSGVGTTVRARIPCE